MGRTVSETSASHLLDESGGYRSIIEAIQLSKHRHDISHCTRNLRVQRIQSNLTGRPQVIFRVNRIFLPWF